MDRKLLSILVCSIQSRKSIMMNSCRILKMQSDENIEIIVNLDSGEKSIGQKRNELLERSRGEYVVFMDDDDMFSPFYVQTIKKALESRPDCVGIKGVITEINKRPRIFIHSLKYKEWSQDEDVYYRSPNHLNPIKSDIAKKVGFKNVSHGEDHDFSIRVFPFLKTEKMIDDYLYYYYPSVKNEK